MGGGDAVATSGVARIGRPLGPLLFFLVLLFPPDVLDTAQVRVAAVTAWTWARKDWARRRVSS